MTFSAMPIVVAVKFYPKPKRSKQILVSTVIPFFHALPIQVEAIIFRINSSRIEYLLLKRLPERNGFWQPVTGGVEEGESRDEALHREIAEETGIENLIRVIGDMYYFEFSDPNLNKEYVYGVEVVATEKVMLDGKEHSEYRWCHIQETMQLLHWKENKEALEKLNTILAN